MKVTRVLALSLACAVAAVPALAEEKKADSKPAAKAAAAAPSQEEMTKAWTAYMTPGKEHALLAKSAGTWTAKVKSWMDPSQPPEETEATMETKVVLGGRYLEDRYEGKMFGQPFSGIGYTGFDNHRKKFVSTWIDSAGTGMMTMTGSLDRSGKVLTMTGTMDDFMTGKPTKLKSVGTFVDDDHHRFEMWMSGPDGKMWKNLEMEYVRKK